MTERSTFEPVAETQADAERRHRQMMAATIAAGYLASFAGGDAEDFPGQQEIAAYSWSVADEIVRRDGHPCADDDAEDVGGPVAAGPAPPRAPQPESVKAHAERVMHALLDTMAIQLQNQNSIPPWTETVERLAKACQSLEQIVGGAF